MRKLRGGLPAIVQHNPLSNSVTVQLLLSGAIAGEKAPTVLEGFGAITRSGSPAELAKLVARVRAAADRHQVAPERSEAVTPDQMLEAIIASTTRSRQPSAGTPLLVVVSGAVDAGAATKLLDDTFGHLPGVRLSPRAFAPQAHQRYSRVRTKTPFAQGALGYVVPAPPPGSREGLAWRLLLYILTHDYSGRLGRSAIGDKGLAYRIESVYRTDGRDAWITLRTGVDPAKADAMESELKTQLAALSEQPPSAAELDAARRHILGRDISAAQSNEELSAHLARQFVETGALRSHAELRRLLDSITTADLAAAAESFSRGTILRVDPIPQE
jgi:predicted Zn-dependent peptidase